MRLGALAEAIEELDPPADLASLTEVLRLRDVFEAKLALGVAAFDRAGLCEFDHASSAVAWLRQIGGMSGAAASSLVKTGRRAADVPALAAAWLEGRLSGGQVQAIVANVSDRHVELFAEHAPDLVDMLVPLSVRDTAAAMQAWRDRADALLGQGQPPEPERSLHLSRTFEARGELKGSFDPASTSVIEEALRVRGHGLVP